MPLLKNDTYTTDYIYSLPEGQRAELIDGKVYNMAPPSFAHQKISGELYTTIRNYIKSQKGNCEVIAAPTIFSFDQTITVGIYGDLNITISELLK